jgi:hypothetical protein
MKYYYDYHYVSDASGTFSTKHAETVLLYVSFHSGSLVETI